MISLEELRKECNSPSLTQAKFLELVFPRQILNSLDTIIKEASRMSRFFNGNLRKDGHTGEAAVVEDIVGKLCDDQSLMNEMILLCNKLAMNYPSVTTNNIHRLISDSEDNIPPEIYSRITLLFEHNKYGNALFWLIMLSFCGKYSKDLMSLLDKPDVETYSPDELPEPLTEKELQGNLPNVYIGIKKDMEKRIPIFRELQGTTELTFVNYASTAFITGPLVDMQYRGGEEQGWLQTHLVGPHAINITLILTNPDSYADTDASRYKMYPHSIPPEIRKYFTLSNESYDETSRELHRFIIRRNFNAICDIMLRKKFNNIHIFYTDIALPVGIMKSKYQNPALNNIKVNMYLPCINIDDKRPTFVLMEKNQETVFLYNIFDDMIRNLNKTPFYGHPDVSFLFRKPIIHRAKLNNSLQEMSRDAISLCAKSDYPIEVDLLPVADQFVIGRDKEITIGASKTRLSRLTKEQLYDLRKELTNPNEERSQLMTLPELLELVQDVAKWQHKEPIPLLLELKDEWECPPTIIRDNVIRICRIMKEYEQKTKGKGMYALHTANPLIIRCVKDYDIRIPCGWITLDFFAHEDIYENLSEEFKQLHSTAACFGAFAYREQHAEKTVNIYYAIPDFVSCKIDDFTSKESTLRKKCAEYNIKLLGWTALNQDQYYKALKQQYFDNVLIENFAP